MHPCFMILRIDLLVVPDGFLCHYGRIWPSAYLLYFDRQLLHTAAPLSLLTKQHYELRVRDPTMSLRVWIERDSDI